MAEVVVELKIVKKNPSTRYRIGGNCERAQRKGRFARGSCDAAVPAGVAQWGCDSAVPAAVEHCTVPDMAGPRCAAVY